MCLRHCRALCIYTFNQSSIWFVCNNHLTENLCNPCENNIAQIVCARVCACQSWSTNSPENTMIRYRDTFFPVAFNRAIHTLGHIYIHWNIISTVAGAYRTGVSFMVWCWCKNEMRKLLFWSKSKQCVATEMPLDHHENDFMCVVCAMCVCMIVWFICFVEVCKMCGI